MAIQEGIPVGTNFTNKNKYPLDSRQQFELLEDMVTYPEAQIPEGFVAYCVETDKFYKFNSSNEATVELGKWKEYDLNGKQDKNDNTLDTENKTIVGAINEINENKQDTLISGTTIKTINDNDILGEGNIEIPGGLDPKDTLVKILRCKYYDSNSTVYDLDDEQVTPDYIANACLSSKYKTFLRFYETEDLYYVLPFIKYEGNRVTDTIPDGQYKFIFEGEYCVETADGDIDHQIKRIEISLTRTNLTWDTAYLVDLVKDKDGHTYIWHSLGDAAIEKQRVDIEAGSGISIVTLNKNIPDDYQQLDYIKASNNTNYFVTDIIANQDTKTEMIIKMDHATTAISHVFGTNVSYKRYHVVFGQSSGYSIRYEASATSPNITLNTLFDRTKITISKNLREILDLENGSVLRDEHITEDFEATGKPIWIGGVNNETTQGAIKWSGRMYSFKLWQGDTLVCDYVPVKRKSDELCGFYDLVTNSFIYEHAGTGVYNPGGVIDGQTKKLSVEVDNTSIIVNEDNKLSVKDDNDMWTATVPFADNDMQLSIIPKQEILYVVVRGTGYSIGSGIGKSKILENITFTNSKTSETKQFNISTKVNSLFQVGLYGSTQGGWHYMAMNMNGNEITLYNREYSTPVTPELGVYASGQFPCTITEVKE